MDKRKHTTSFCVRVALVGMAVLVAWPLFSIDRVPAHAQPPPPPDTPTATLEPTRTIPPSATPEPTNTNTPVPTPTNTSPPTVTDAPTSTDAPTPTDAPTSPAPTDTPNTPKPTATLSPTEPPQPTNAPPPAGNPECQSRVEGTVLGANGVGIVGATVVIEGDGWSNSLMTNEDGRYGFASLCAGTVSLQAFLPGGQATGIQTATVTGKNVVQVNLRMGMQPTSAPTASVPSPKQATATAAPQMPATGSSSWLLLGAALGGALLFLVAGASRVARVRSRVDDD